MIRRATVHSWPVALLVLIAIVIATALACNGDTSRPETPTPSATPSPTPMQGPLEIPAPPDRDLFDLALRFELIPPGTTPSVRSEPFNYKEGDVDTFTLFDLQTPGYRTVRAVMRKASEHAYFFFQEGSAVNAEALEIAARDFDALIYATVTDLFGHERSPGIDADPRITILHADLRGLGGYVSGSDAFPVAISPRSNQREMVYIDLAIPLGGAQYNAVLGHELQHLVHDNADPGEEAWVNEGLSQVALEEFGADDGAISAFLLDPDLQLNDWSLLNDDPTPHYGASQLFFRYLLDRFGGREKAHELIHEAADGIAGVDAYLLPYDVSFNDVFADWLAANNLDLTSGPYAHQGSLPRGVITTPVSAFGSTEGTVAQFGADYYEIALAQDQAIFRFDGADTVPALAVQPYSGQAIWWSNRGDSIDSRLTRRFDLTEVRTATLQFWTWYETEEGWDYAYAAVSSDNGLTWLALPGLHTTDFNPLAQAYGPAYTGNSGTKPGRGSASESRWVQESIDLSAFAGQEILIRFEYVSDDAANLRGFAVDDISIPEIGFFDDAEAAGEWQAKGFVRLDHPLPQRFILQTIDRATGEVQQVPLDSENNAEILIDGAVTIVVAAATDITREHATYHWELSVP